MRDESDVIALVSAARDGQKQAWDRLVDRYAPLVWSICRRYGLTPTDTEDVGQHVWLRLVEQLGRIREPAALPGWIVTTTRRECLRSLRAGQRMRPDETALEQAVADDSQLVVDEILRHERHLALREAFAQLPDRCRHMLTLLMQDPPVPYTEISAQLGMSVGSIGPNRARCLHRLRQCPALAALLQAEAELTGGGDTP